MHTTKNLILNRARRGTARVSFALEGYLYSYREAEFCSTNCLRADFEIQCIQVTVVRRRLLSEYDSCPNPKFGQQSAICTIVRTRLMSESGQFGFGQESFSDKSRTRLPDTHKEQVSFPNTLAEQASLQSYKCSSRTRMLDTHPIFRDKFFLQIPVMESGLNLDTAIRRGN